MKRKHHFLCPDCLKLGVYVKFSQTDSFVCRYCGFNCYTDGGGQLDLDRRKRLEWLNPDGSAVYGRI